MDAFAKYDNTLGFFVGNEDIAAKDDSHAAPYLKAAARDMKAYRDRMDYRTIPIGYSAADIKELRPMLQDYFTCGGNSSEIMDFFALNSYSWCDPSTYETSDYKDLQAQAENFPVPIFFSETGCIIPGPRIWEDQEAIFSEPMINDWSGAMVYEWIQEQNDYGIISYGPPADATATGSDIFDGFTRKGTPTPRQPDFSNLSSRWATITPTGVAKSDYDPDSVSTRDCPTSTESGWWRVDGNVELPTVGATYEGEAASPSPSSTESATSSSSDDPEESGESEEPESTDDAIAVKHVTGMMAGLVAMTLLFTIWL